MKTNIEMAREADVYCTTRQPTLDAMLERFAALVRADEREACAKVCETAEVPIDIDVWQGTKKALSAATALGLAAAIRARGE